MSLINQMLCDLERRQAPALYGSTAALTDLSASELKPIRRWPVRSVLPAIWLLLGGACLVAIYSWSTVRPAVSVQMINARLASEPPRAIQISPLPDPSPVATSPAPDSLAGLVIALADARNWPGWDGALASERSVRIDNHSPVSVGSAGFEFSEPRADEFADLPGDGWSLEARPMAARVDIRPSSSPPREVRLAEGYAHEQQRDLSAAREVYESLLVEDPAYLKARLRLVGVALGMGDSRAAELALARGLEYTRDEPRLAQPYARLLVERNDFGQALEVLAAAMSKGQSNPDYLAFVAALLQNSARHVEAAAMYRQALALQPGAAHWWMGLGISLDALGDRLGALSAFQRAQRGAGLAPEVSSYIRNKLASLRARI